MKFYWKVWTDKKLWNQVNKKRLKDRLTWTGLISILFESYLGLAHFQRTENSKNYSSK